MSAQYQSAASTAWNCWLMLFVLSRFSRAPGVAAPSGGQVAPTQPVQQAMPPVAIRPGDDANMNMAQRLFKQQQQPQAAQGAPALSPPQQQQQPPQQQPPLASQQQAAMSSPPAAPQPQSQSQQPPASQPQLGTSDPVTEKVGCVHPLRWSIAFLELPHFNFSSKRHPASPEVLCMDLDCRRPPRRRRRTCWPWHPTCQICQSRTRHMPRPAHKR